MRLSKRPHVDKQTPSQCPPRCTPDHLKCVRQAHAPCRHQVRGDQRHTAALALVAVDQHGPARCQDADNPAPHRRQGRVRWRLSRRSQPITSCHPCYVGIYAPFALHTPLETETRCLLCRCREAARGAPQSQQTSAASAAPGWTGMVMRVWGRRNTERCVTARCQTDKSSQ